MKRTYPTVTEGLVKRGLDEEQREDVLSWLRAVDEAADRRAAIAEVMFPKPVKR